MHNRLVTNSVFVIVQLSLKAKYVILIQRIILIKYTDESISVVFTNKDIHY